MSQTSGTRELVKQSAVSAPAKVPQPPASISEFAEELPDIETQLDRANRFGHRLGGASGDSGKPPVIQAKLTVGPANDEYEREADQVADRVMRMSVPSGEARTIQRENNPGEEEAQRTGSCPSPTRCPFGGACHTCPLKVQAKPATGQMGDEEEEEEEDAAAESVLRKAESPASHQGDFSAPSIVHEALHSPGQPLDLETRAYMEPRFGQDFSQVRVHSDARAAASAQAVNALAYTVGNNVVFDAGQYRPQAAMGRRILAHELTHVVQQSGAKSQPNISRRREPLLLQRQCAAAPCPVASLPLDAFFPRWKMAELCIQQKYQQSHPGNTVSTNKSWTTLNGKTPREQQALTCLKTKGFTAKSGMVAGEPDIWDFTNNTMYEITTLSGGAFRAGKLVAEVKLANDLTSTAECGGNVYTPGDWAPKDPCYAMGGDLFIRVYNVGGVLIYTVLKDASKELALSALLAAIAMGAKSGLFKGMGRGLLGAAGKKLLPGYAIASCIAAILLIGSGRAEAKIGLGGDDPLVALYKAMDAKGEPIPPEIRQMIESDPELKKIVEDGLKGPNPTAAQKELSKKILKIIQDNADQFSAEDLKTLFALTQSTGSQMPEGDLTAETLKKLITQKGGSIDQPSTAEKDATKKDKQGGVGTGSHGLSTASLGKIAKAGPAVKLVFDKLFPTPADPSKPRLTDADVDRFVSLFPKDLSVDVAKRVLEKTKPWSGETIDDLISLLRIAMVEELGSKPPKTGASTDIGGVKPPPRGKTTPKSVDLAELVKAAGTGDFSGLTEGNGRVSWSDKDKEGDIHSEITLMIIKGNHAAGVVSFRIMKIGAKSKTVEFVDSSEFVNAKGKIVLPRGALVGNTAEYTKE